MISRRVLLVLILLLGIPTVVALAAGLNDITPEADPLAAISLTMTHTTDHPSEGPFTYSLGAVFSATWNGSAGEPFGRPQDLAVDQSGNIFVTDSFNNRVYKFDLAGNLLAGWGSVGTEPGQFNAPGGVAVSSNGDVYVVDRGNHRIQKFDSEGQFLTMWGNKGSAPAEFESPQGIAVDLDGNVYVADTGNHRIQKFDPGGDIVALWGEQGVNLVQFDAPYGVAVDGHGDIYVAEWANHRIQVLDSTGAYRTTWGTFGTEPGQFQGPTAVAVRQGEVYVADGANHRIQKFKADGRFLAGWGYPGSSNGAFNGPTGVAVDENGHVYVVDRDNKRIQRFEQPTFTLDSGEEVTLNNLPAGSFSIYASPEDGWTLGTVNCTAGTPEMELFGVHLILSRDEVVQCDFIHHELDYPMHIPYAKGSTADPDPGAFHILNVRVFIDGRSRLIVQGDTVYWHHDDAAAPGRHRMTPSGNLPTFLNNNAWYPVWPGDPPGHPPADPINNEVRDCHCDSIDQYQGVPVLAAVPQTVEWFEIQAREEVVIVQQPEAGNGYTLIVEINDNLTPGPTWYEIGLDYLIEDH